MAFHEDFKTVRIMPLSPLEAEILALKVGA
jgi:hypothetical protein